MSILEQKTDESAFRRMIRALSEAFFGRERTVAAGLPREPDPSGASSNDKSGLYRTRIHQRLIDAAARLGQLEAERGLRCTPGLEKTIEERIIWGELLELELQDLDEHLARLEEQAGALRTPDGTQRMRAVR